MIAVTPGIIKKVTQKLRSGYFSVVRGLAAELKLHRLDFLDWGDLELLEDLVAILVRGGTEVNDLPLDGVSQGRHVGESYLQLNWVLEISLMIFYADIIDRYL